MSEKLFEPSVDKLRYTITIDVYENCTCLNVKKGDDFKGDLSYHEIVGVLDSHKFDLMLKQKGYNLSKKLKVKNPNKKYYERKSKGDIIKTFRYYRAFNI